MNKLSIRCKNCNTVFSTGYCFCKASGIHKTPNGYELFGHLWETVDVKKKNVKGKKKVKK